MEIPSRSQAPKTPETLEEDESEEDAGVTKVQWLKKRHALRTTTPKAKPAAKATAAKKATAGQSTAAKSTAACAAEKAPAVKAAMHTACTYLHTAYTHCIYTLTHLHTRVTIALVLHALWRLQGGSNLQ